MNFGFNWNAVPPWIWGLMLLALGALIMLAVDIFVLGRWRRGQTSKKMLDYEAQIASFADEKATLKTALTQAQTEANQQVDLAGPERLPHRLARRLLDHLLASFTHARCHRTDRDETLLGAGRSWR